MNTDNEESWKLVNFWSVSPLNLRFLTYQMVRLPSPLSVSKENTSWEVRCPSLAVTTPWILGPMTLGQEVPHATPRSWPLIGLPWPRPSLAQPMPGGL